MKQKFLMTLLALLCSSLAHASPITLDQIYAPQGLQILAPNGSFSFPNGNAAFPNDGIVSVSSVQTLANKSFDKTSAVPKQGRFVYDFATLGGATNAAYSMGLNLPNKSVITRVWIDFVTQLASSTSAKINVTANSTGDLLASTGLGQLPSTGFFQGVPAGTTATYVKLTAASNLYVNITNGSITAGKFVVFVDYSVSE